MLKEIIKKLERLNIPNTYYGVLRAKSLGIITAKEYEVCMFSLILKRK